MHVTASTTCLRPIRIPAPSPEAAKAAVLAKWYAVTGEARAKRILYMAGPTAEKIARRSREGLRAAIKIIGADPVDTRDLRAVQRDLSRSGCLANIRAGHLDDDSLWEDARHALGIAQVAAERKRAASGAVELLGKSLGVVEALLSVPEGERAAVVGMREMA